jgi:hypothetical protein
MPLVPEAERLIRGNLAVLKRGKKPKRVTIGHLTEKQVTDINTDRVNRGFIPLSGEIYFVGTHLYDSRIVRDGYSDDDVWKMIQAAMSTTCRFINTTKMTVLQNPSHRDGGYGCTVRDELTLECTSSPLAELYSVVPRGDRNHKPNATKKAAE